MIKEPLTLQDNQFNYLQWGVFWVTQRAQYNCKGTLRERQEGQIWREGNVIMKTEGKCYVIWSQGTEEQGVMLEVSKFNEFPRAS